MSTHDKETAVAEALDRVPMEMLEAAILRRVHKVNILSGSESEEFQRRLEKLSELSGIPGAMILGSSTREDIVRVRWQLYHELEEAGWTVIRIQHATGHDYDRIRYGLRELRKRSE